MKYLSLLVGLILFLSSAIQAQKDYKLINNTSQIAEKFQSVAGSLKTMQSNFVQEKYLASLSSTIISSGQFWYKKEDKVRWEYLKPFKYLVIKKDGKILLKDENGLRILNKNPNKAFEQMGKILESSIKGNLINDLDYSTKISQNSKYIKIELTPIKDEISNDFKLIELFFLKGKYSIQRIKLTEVNDDSISIIFENMKVGIPINESFFQIDK